MGDTTSKLSFVMEMVDKITTPISKVTDQTKKSAAAIEATQKQISRLSQSTADLDAFKRLKRESVETSRALDAQNKKVADLARQMRMAEKPTRAMTNEFNKAKREAQQLSQQHERENQKLSALRSKLDQAGISTKNLRQATAQVERHTARLNDRLKDQQQQLEAVAQREKKLAGLREKNSQLMGSAAMDTAKVGAATYALAKLSESYGQVASAQGTIQSLGVGAEGIDAITKAAKDFSNQWSGTTQAEFIAASYDIKSGISSLSDTAVGEFTRIAAMTAGATKSTTEQMTSLFASGYGIYRKQFDQFGATTIAGWNTMSAAERDMKFGEYFSAGIASSVKVFKTNGSEMSSAISSLGAAATASNVPFAEQLSILGQLQATMSGSEAATKYKAFLRSAAKASEDLGLSVLDSNNQLLSMPEILEEMRSKYGDTLDEMEKRELHSVFGDEGMALITQLYPEIDRLKENIGSMNVALNSGMATTNEMAQAILLGPNESVERMNQRISNLTATLGKVFAPMMMFVTDTIGSAAMGIADLAERFPFLTQFVGGAVMALIALKTVMIGVKMAQVAWNLAMITGMQRMTLMAGLQRAMAAATAVWTAAQWALNAALNANPIGLIVMAVMALIGVVALIVQYWEPLGEFFSNLWDGIVAKFQSAMQWVTDTVSKVKGWWDSIFGDDEKVTKAVELSSNIQQDSNRPPAYAGYGGVVPARTGIAASHTAPSNYTSSYQIAIEQQPGESGDDVARRVREELDRREREKARSQRGALYDIG
ncbi:phage tail tape measure protein [Vibrio parahaemolyticus]|uniref:phage tail tape measure protein n=1 Tax=Vibrio parahaemolyticus TaxID=670 RepID=UPI001D169368|nr:phage tail tape measure protein [Vibrio parahaemolyticus]MCC3798271.1 phage tail tape measure protein [Vibrio parahaemolyticus]